MTAKEMFEKLGYKLVFANENVIEYKNQDTEEYISFDIKQKLYNKRESNFIYAFIDCEEHKTINKQVEELG